ncbi:MAG TPA: hypothetical protein VGB91_09405 [Rhizomicrobium sp.]
MSVYLDSSAIAPIFVPDIFAAKIEAFFLTGPAGIAIGDFGAAEFCIGHRNSPADKIS